MNTFAPVFSSIVDSSLWMEPDFVCKAFVTLIAIKDSDHIARVNAFGLGRKCWPMEPEEAEKRAIAALKILQSPDTKRLEPQAFNGRRIKKVEDGYLILNGDVYEKLMRKVSLRAYKARKEREYRAAKAQGSAETGLEKIAIQCDGDGDDPGYDDAVTKSLPKGLQ